MLLTHLVQVLRQRWCGVFPQERTFLRAAALLLGLLTTYGRRTVSRALCAEGRAQVDWAADYRAFSRSPWKASELFLGVLATALPHVPETGFITALMDDTSLRKRSRVIKAARWLRDALSPPFHVNLKYGLRCLHLALALPLSKHGHGARAISIDFELAPSAKKPGRKATATEVAAYLSVKDAMSLPMKGVQALTRLRAGLDSLGASTRQLLAVVDGGYTNQRVLRNLPDRVDLLGRTRKDIVLFTPAQPGGRRIYGDRLPTPDEIRVDPSRPYQSVTCHYGGDWRTVRYKELSNVLWRRGCGRRLLRLLVIAPTPYQGPGRAGRILYRDPAFLVTTDLTSPAQALIQAYLDRWQIEVLHRDLKSGLGLGQAQVWSDESVSRLHSAVVAAFAMLTLAALETFGPGRAAEFPPLPLWRRRKPQLRPSHVDLITLLRNDLATHDALRPRPAPRPDTILSAPGWNLSPRETYALT
jgi:hypothetical protein